MVDEFAWNKAKTIEKDGEVELAVVADQSQVTVDEHRELRGIEVLQNHIYYRESI